MRTTTTDHLSLWDPALALAADVLDDIERVRIANENRLRQLTRSGEDQDGEERGFGLTMDHPDVARLAAMVDVLKKVEHDAVLELQRKLRKHPLGPWMRAQKGVGDKQGARLLAAIGDPYWRDAYVKTDGTEVLAGPRTVSALWAYCGLHVLPGSQSTCDDQATSAAGDQHRDAQGNCDIREIPGVAARRKRGERANWSANAKMRVYLIAESCMKKRDPACRDGHSSGEAHGTPAVLAGDPSAGRSDHWDDDAPQADVIPACGCSPYRLVYERRRAHTAVTHPEWTDGHAFADALRVTAKEILKHIWREAKRLHQEQGDDHSLND